MLPGEKVSLCEVQHVELGLSVRNRHISRSVSSSQGCSGCICSVASLLRIRQRYKTAKTRNVILIHTNVDRSVVQNNSENVTQG